MAALSDEELAELPADTRMLELGSGPTRVWSGSVSVDVNPRSHPDVLHDLNHFPWPFEDNSFDIVVAEHVIEHLEKIIPTVEEVHRILRTGGLFLVEVPHFSSHHYFTDPTHLHAFSAKSFDYFVPPEEEGSDLHRSLFDFRYSDATFRKLSVTLDGYNKSRFRRMVHRFANRHPTRYESELAWTLPVDTITFRLQAVDSDAVSQTA